MVQSYSLGGANVHPHLIHASLEIPESTAISSATFAQLTTEYPYTLQWAACFPLKTVPLRGEYLPI